MAEDGLCWPALVGFGQGWSQMVTQVKQEHLTELQGSRTHMALVVKNGFQSMQCNYMDKKERCVVVFGYNVFSRQ